MDMYRGRLSSFGPVCLIHCVSRRLQSHHGALPVWPCWSLSVCLFSVPTVGLMVTTRVS